MILRKVKFNIKIRSHLVFSFVVVSSQVLKKEIFRGVFRTLSNDYDEVFLGEIVKCISTVYYFRKKVPL